MFSRGQILNEQQQATLEDKFCVLANSKFTNNDPIITRAIIQNLGIHEGQKITEINITKGILIAELGDFLAKFYHRDFYEASDLNTIREEFLEIVKETHNLGSPLSLHQVQAIESLVNKCESSIIEVFGAKDKKDIDSSTGDLGNLTDSNVSTPEQAEEYLTKFNLAVANLPGGAEVLGSLHLDAGRVYTNLPFTLKDMRMSFASMVEDLLTDKLTRAYTFDDCIEYFRIVANEYLSSNGASTNGTKVAAQVIAELDADIAAKLESCRPAFEELKRNLAKS